MAETSDERAREDEQEANPSKGLEPKHPSDPGPPPDAEITGEPYEQPSEPDIPSEPARGA